MSRNTELLERLLMVTTLLERDLAQELGALGLTPSRTHLLWVLHSAGPSTQQSLASALAVSARNVTGLVDGLEATGFVTRQPHPSDRRATSVTLTEHGERIMSRMTEEQEALATALFGALPDRDAAVVADTLDTVVTRLSELIAQADAARRPA